MSTLDWKEIPAINGFQLVYKLVKKAEKIRVPGPEKKSLVLAEIEKCKATDNKFAKAIVKFEQEKILDEIIERVAICNQGKRKIEKIKEMSEKHRAMRKGAIVEEVDN